LPISAVDTISLAFQHTKRQLAQPFRFAQWVRLAFVGLLAGELGSGSNFHLPSSLKGPHQNSPLPSGIPKIDPAVLAGLIAVLVVAGLIVFVVMTYISSVMRFILFDSVLTRECRIRAGWNRRQDAGWKYFLWQLGFTLFIFGSVIILVGVPAVFAFAMGWFSPPRAHVLPLVLGGIIVFGLFLVFIVAVAVVHVFTKDFVVPQMALENIGAIEAWRRLWPMIQAEMNGYAIYAVMKILLAIGAGIVVGIATFILIMVLAIPAVAFVLVLVTAGKTAGLTWNVFTITIAVAVVAACILFAILMFVISLISVPVIVFFPAFAMYFFAARYRPLSLVLYPPPPPTFAVPGGTPPPETPPVTPNSAPAS